MKRIQPILASLSLLLAGAFTARAQTDATASSSSARTPSSSYHATSEFGASKGDWEFSLGGGGASNRALNNSLGGVNASLGYFLTDGLEVSMRQFVNYSNGPGGGGTDYDGATFAGIDAHFGTGRLHPFVGVTFGRLYGDSTNDSWAAGIEGGLKFYVLSKTFLFATGTYDWIFSHASRPADNFSDGAFLWSLGVGFNF